MLSKCSNPRCSVPFLYLHTGKLFRFAKRNDAVPGHDPHAKAPRGVEFFWLCDDCAGQFTLEADAAHGVHVISLPRRAIGAAASL